MNLDLIIDVIIIRIMIYIYMTLVFLDMSDMPGHVFV